MTTADCTGKSWKQDFLFFSLSFSFLSGIVGCKKNLYVLKNYLHLIKISFTGF